jgi:hypothetical protein
MGKIGPCKSLAGRLNHFVPKAHGTGLRLSIVYRRLNEITILNSYPLPVINEPRDYVQGTKLFTKIDIKAEYNRILMHISIEGKRAFRSR